MSSADLLQFNFLQPVLFDVPKRYKDKNFQNFEVTNKLQKQFEIIKRSEGSLTLTGKTGTGKTHLAIAKAKSLQPKLINDDKITERRKELFERYLSDDQLKTAAEAVLESEAYKFRRQTVLFISAVKFFLEMNETVMKGESRLDRFKVLTKEPEISLAMYAQGFLQIENFDLIILDDLGAEKMTEAARQNLYFLIDERYRQEMNMIVTSNFTIEQINENELRIASRLSEMGHVLLFNSDDYRLKT